MTGPAATHARLSTSTLDRARAASVSRADRAEDTWVTHLGLGAFARAHLGVYMDDLLRVGRRGLWRGVSLHSPRVAQLLTPQDCYYTVAEREPGSDLVLRVVGSLASAATGAVAAHQALTVPSTRLVTLTITEKGYDAPAAHAPGADILATAPGSLARALACWRALGLSPPVVSPLDNVAHNGDVLRMRVGEAADQLEPGLREWIETAVPFCSSVVDRMVPAPTQKDLETIEHHLGLVDRAAVATEHHRSWVVEAHEKLAFLADAGVELVDDITPFERRKLWLLNGPHSALAYCGLLMACPSIAQAAGHGIVARFVRTLVEDILEGSPLPAELKPAEFAADALGRFANPYLTHSCAQVAADGSRKLPQRFGPVVAARRDRGLATTRLAAVVALWIAAAAGIAIRGGTLPPIEEPDSLRLRAAKSRDLHQVVGLALEGRFDEHFTGEASVMLGRLVNEGGGLLESLA